GFASHDSRYNVLECLMPANALEEVANGGVGHGRAISIVATPLDCNALPPATPEPDNRQQSQKRVRGHNRPVCAREAEASGKRQYIGGGKLEGPETDQVEDGRGRGVASSVECRGEDHSVGVGYVAVAEDAKSAGRELNDCFIVRQPGDDRPRENNENQADA